LITVTVQSSNPTEPSAQAEGEYIVCLVAAQLDPNTLFTDIKCLIHADKQEFLLTMIVNLLAYAIYYAETELHLIGLREICLESLKHDPRRIHYRR
jgi:hypothetical protein